MFEGRKLKKLNGKLEDAAIEVTMAERLGPPPGDPAHSAARNAVISAARAATASGLGDEVQRVMTEAETHPMFRGEDKSKWSDFVGAVVAEL